MRDPSRARTDALCGIGDADILLMGAWRIRNSRMLMSGRSSCSMTTASGRVASPSSPCAPSKAEADCAEICRRTVTPLGSLEEVSSAELRGSPAGSASSSASGGAPAAEGIRFCSDLNPDRDSRGWAVEVACLGEEALCPMVDIRGYRDMMFGDVVEMPPGLDYRIVDRSSRSRQLLDSSHARTGRRSIHRDDL